MLQYKNNSSYYVPIIISLGVKTQQLLSLCLDLGITGLAKELQKLDLELLELLEEKAGFDPDQPRVPAGNPDGGQWTDGAGSGGGVGIGDSGGQGLIPINDFKPAQNMDSAVGHLEESAGTLSTGACAARVREALNEGGGFNVGVPNDGHGYAKNFGEPLEKAGFEKVAGSNYYSKEVPATYPPDGYIPHAGDVVVMGNYPAQNPPAGHMAMYTGSRWVSDFRQREFWPGEHYRAYKPSYMIYRHPDHQSINL